MFFIHENAIENDIFKTAAIFFQPQKGQLPNTKHKAVA